jgi:benzil reductase ((S)-benzoin forming)
MVYYFITGTSRGIGKALAEKVLERENHIVYGFARQATIQHPRYHHCFIDLSDIDYLIEHVGDFFLITKSAEKIVLVNNAGVLGDVGYLGEIDNQSIKKVFELNTIAPTIMMNEFINCFKETKAEKIILNVSSGAGKYPVDGWSSYCASKSALDMASEVASKELHIRNDDFRVFALAPGIVDTFMQDEIRKTRKESFSSLQKFVDYKNHGMLSSTHDVAEKFLFLIDYPNRFPDVIQDVRKY